MAVANQFDGRKMIPHVTIAHFATIDVEPLLAKAAKLATKFVGSMNVSSIEVREWYPNAAVNRPIARFRLGGRQWRSRTEIAMALNRPMGTRADIWSNTQTWCARYLVSRLLARVA